MATPSFQQILEILDAHGVDYIIVGGVAAVLRGAPVTTFDMDALVKLDRSNAEKLIAAFETLDARYREHREKVRPTVEDVLAGGHLLLMTNCGPLDVLGHLTEGKRYEDVRDRAPELIVGGQSVRVLLLEALVEEKRKLGRPKDRAVLELLEAVLQRQKTP